MKRIFTLLLIAAFSCINVSATPFLPSTSTPVEIKEGGGSGSGGDEDDPKGINTIPIICEYSEATSELVFCFLSDLGNVTITVTNFLNGEVVTDTVNSQFGIVNFPISGNAGFYYISILTPSGTTYHGQFAL